MLYTKSLFYAGQNSRDVTTCDLGFEFVSATHFTGFNGVVDFSELSRSTRLLLVGVGVFDHLGNGFAVSHLRLTHININTVGTLQDVDFDIQSEVRPYPS